MFVTFRNFHGTLGVGDWFWGKLTTRTLSPHPHLIFLSLQEMYSMATLDRTLHVEQAAKQLTLHCGIKLRGVRQWRWRLVLGMWLIRLAAWVMWVNVEIEREGD